MEYQPTEFGDLIIRPEKVAEGKSYYIRLTIGKVSRVYSFNTMKRICNKVLEVISQIENSQKENIEYKQEINA